MIPRHLHTIWIGDESQCPKAALQSWRDHHPGWDFTLWGNEALNSRTWRCSDQLAYYVAHEKWPGAADIMRYNILAEQGGIYVDADSYCLKPLEEEWLSLPLFACYESEKHRPGLVANSFIGCEPGHPVLDEALTMIAKLRNPGRRWSWRHLRFCRQQAWKSVGPLLFTKALAALAAQGAKDVTLMPSWTFFPRHYLDTEERTGPDVYARHLWGSSLS